MSAVGFDLYPWQRAVLEPWLAHSENGMWAASSVGLSVPRQNGKTEGCIIPRVIFGLTIYGEWVVYTAQIQKTATETFEAMAAIFDHRNIRNKVDVVKTGQGREEIRLKNGGRIKFLARTRNGGRGQHGDLLIFDEAQDLSESQQDSFMPAISASLNPQTIYTGTPPKPEDGGYVFRRIRDDALAGRTEHVSWAEWSVEELPRDSADRKLWEATNPSIGIRILPTTIEAEQETMSPDGFARERLGWWTPAKVLEPPAIDLGAWEDCETDEPPVPDDDERLACGIKFSADGSTYSVSMAARPKEGPVLVECIDRTGTAHGIGGLIDWVWERRGKLSTVRVDGRQWTATFVQNLMERGFPKKALEVASTTNMVDACAMFAGGVLARNLVHTGQPLLNDSITTSPRRQVGSEGWAFGGEDPTPAESCALAYWGAMTTKRNPRRKLRVSV